MAMHQGLRRRAHCQILLDGHDVTLDIDPFLISVNVLWTIREVSRCTIELDDRDAKLAIPPFNTPIEIKIGWSPQGPFIPPVPTPIPAGSELQLPYEGSMLRVFHGWTQSCESGFARRGGGRRLWVEGLVRRETDTIKQPRHASWGEGEKKDSDGGMGKGVSLGQVLQDVAKKAGLNAKVSPSMAGIERDFWHMNESPMHMFQRLADEVGGRVAYDGEGNVEFMGADETTGVTHDAEWGLNLIAWRIKPFVPRPQYGSSKTNFFNILGGSWLDTVQSIGGETPFGGANAQFGLPHAAPNKQTGGQWNGGAEKASSSRRAEGWVLINGEPAIQISDRINIIGARPGINGSWFVEEVEHQYSRRGFTTRLNISNPEGFAADWENMGHQLHNVPGGEVSSTTQQGEAQT